MTTWQQSLQSFTLTDFLIFRFLPSPDTFHTDWNASLQWLKISTASKRLSFLMKVTTKIWSRTVLQYFFNFHATTGLLYFWLHGVPSSQDSRYTDLNQILCEDCWFHSSLSFRNKTPTQHEKEAHSSTEDAQALLTVLQLFISVDVLLLINSSLIPAT